MKNSFRALYIAFASLLGFDVRITRSGKAFFQLRDHRAEYRAKKRLIRKIAVRS